MYLSARKGEIQKLQETHEAYQVIVKVIRAKNTFFRKAIEKNREKEKAANNAEVVANAWKNKFVTKKQISFE